MNGKFSLGTMSVIAIMTTAGCSKQITHDSQPSPAQQQSLAGNPFDPNAGSTPGNTDIDGTLEDAYRPVNGLEVTDASQLQWVKRCTPDQYQVEKNAAIAEALADPSGMTIPVRYSISVGTAQDEAAKFSQERAILRVDDPGVSPVYVGASDEIKPGLYYLTNHVRARAEYLQGKKCWFSTITAVASASGDLTDDLGRPSWTKTILYYGDNYSGALVSNAPYSPRLFSELAPPPTSPLCTIAGKHGASPTLIPCPPPPQIIPLYVADIRPGVIDPHSVYPNILNPDFVSSPVRREEYQVNYKKLFDLRTFAHDRDDLAKNLMMHVVSTSDGVFKSYPLEGAPQLIENILDSTDTATVTSTQYTPIALDLGRPGLATSSLAEGVYFDLAHLSDQRNGNPITHKTAWLGGYIEEFNLSADPTAPANIQAHEFRRVIEDGFLVIPRTDGTVQTGADLLGSLTQINGASYSNGFEALRALGNKDCTSSDLKQSYIGPWDGSLYSRTIQVWVDQNRNGRAEPSELISLENAHVAAIDTCNVISQSNTDRYGNSTALRSSFLLMDAGEQITGNETEILNRLSTGQKSDGTTATFRLAADIYFQTDPSHYLEDVDSQYVVAPPSSGNGGNGSNTSNETVRHL